MEFHKFRDIFNYLVRRNWTRNLEKGESYRHLRVERAERHIKLNRAGNLGSGILFFIFFLMMIMIAGGLAGGSYAFFGKGDESRLKESEALFLQVKKCFDKQNFFDAGFTERPELFYEKCYLSKEVLEDGAHLVYVKRNSDGKEFFAGIYDYNVRCDLDARFKNKDLPLCKRDVIGDYEILTASSQNAKRVAA